MLRRDIMIRPELRTPGGEVSDILYDGHYIGHITLVYREKEILSGSIQLDSRQLSAHKEAAAMDAVNEYIQALVSAWSVPECDVRVTKGKFEYVIATERNVGTIEEFVDSPGRDSFHIDDEAELDEYELVIVGEEEDLLQYHIYRESDQDLVAEAFIVCNDAEISGEMIWKDTPDEQELDIVTELLISDFDEDQIDSITIDMKYDGECFESIELIHQDVVEDDENDVLLESDTDEYSAMLIRDEGDVLVYDLFWKAEGDRPIAQATIDISRLQVSGIIEFEHETDESFREIIAETLMDELDKELNFVTFHVTMLHRQVPIDNILFENETMHHPQ